MRGAVCTLIALVGVASAGPRTKQPDVSIAFGVPTTVGFPDMVSVVKGVKTRAPALRRCHTPSEATAGNDTARLTLHLAVDGRVSASSAIGLDDKANACIVAATATLRFARSKDGRVATVTYPITYLTADSAMAVLKESGYGLGTLDELKLCANCITDKTNHESATPTSTGLDGGYRRIGDQVQGTADIGDLRRRSRSSRPVARVTLGQPTVTGGDAAIVRRHMKRWTSPLRDCYETKLFVNPTFQGTTVVAFTYGHDGKVISASASGMNDKDFELCVANTIKRSTFVSTDAPQVSVSYPITFAPPP